MTQSDELRSLGAQAAQARADVEYLIERVRERARADEARVRRSAAIEAAGRLRRLRDGFRRDLASLRDDVHSRTRAAGPSVASWRDDVWKELNPDGIGGDATEPVSIRIGDLALFPSDDGEDLLSLPATFTLDEDDAVVIETAEADAERVRGALLGWCLRIVATLGRRRVSVLWLDTEDGQSTVPVPPAWRPDPGGPQLDPYIARLHHHVERGGARRRDRTGEPRLVVVVIDSGADRAPSMKRLVDEIGDHQRSHGVHLIVASTSWSVPTGQGVLRLAALESRSRFVVAADDLGTHELTLQDAPPAEIAERLAEWTVPPPRIDDLAEPATKGHDDAPTRDEHAHGLAPTHPATERTHDDPPSTAASEAPPPAGATVSHLLGLLDAPSRHPPTLTFGHLEDGTAVTTTLDRAVFMHGGSARVAAERMATFVAEVACQASADDVDFAVLDLSDGSIVADRFDRIIDLLPHLVDVVDGVGVILALEEAVERIETASTAEPARLVLAIAPDPLSERVVSLIERIARRGQESRVTLCLWTPSEDVAPGLEASRDAIVTFDDGRVTLRLGDRPMLEARSTDPAPVEDMVHIGHAIREARG